MHISLSRLLGVAAVAAALGLTGTAVAQDKISQEEMEAAFKGTTFNTEDFGETGTMAFGDDGSLHIKLQTIEDTGTYRFGEGGYCSTWTKLRTTEACFTATKVGDNQYRLWTADGKEDALLTLP